MNTSFMSYDLLKTAKRKQRVGVNYVSSNNTDKNGYHNIRSVLKKAKKVYENGYIIEYRPFQATTLPETPLKLRNYVEFKKWIKKEYLLCFLHSKYPTSYYVGIPVTCKCLNIFATSKADLYIVQP